MPSTSHFYTLYSAPNGPGWSGLKSNPDWTEKKFRSGPGPVQKYIIGPDRTGTGPEPGPNRTEIFIFFLI